MPTPEARRVRYQEILAAPPADRAAELPELYAELARLGLHLGAPVLADDAFADQAEQVVDPDLSL